MTIAGNSFAKVHRPATMLTTGEECRGTQVTMAGIPARRWLADVDRGG